MSQNTQTNQETDVINVIDDLVSQIDSVFNIQASTSTSPLLLTPTTSRSSTPVQPEAPKKSPKSTPYVQGLEDIGWCLEEKPEVKPQCSVCYTDLTLGNCVITDCNHEFCNTCFFRWMKTNQTCPICRKKFISPIDMEAHWEEIGEVNRDLIRENRNLRRLNSVIKSRVSSSTDALLNAKIQSKRACLRMARVSHMTNKIVGHFEDKMKGFTENLENVNEIVTVLNNTEFNANANANANANKFVFKPVELEEGEIFVFGGNANANANANVNPKKNKKNKKRRRVMIKRRSKSKQNTSKKLKTSVGLIHYNIESSIAGVAKLANEIIVENTKQIAETNMHWENCEFKAELKCQNALREDPYMSVPEIAGQYNFPISNLPEGTVRERTFINSINRTSHRWARVTASDSDMSVSSDSDATDSDVYTVRNNLRYSERNIRSLRLARIGFPPRQENDDSDSDSDDDTESIGSMPELISASDDDEWEEAYELDMVGEFFALVDPEE